jgi:hypothetical protein
VYDQEHDGPPGGVPLLVGRLGAGSIEGLEVWRQSKKHGGGTLRVNLDEAFVHHHAGASGTLP